MYSLPYKLRKNLLLTSFGGGATFIATLALSTTMKIPGLPYFIIGAIFNIISQFGMASLIHAETKPE